MDSCRTGKRKEKKNKNGSGVACGGGGAQKTQSSAIDLKGRAHSRRGVSRTSGGGSLKKKPRIRKKSLGLDQSKGEKWRGGAAEGV